MVRACFALLVLLLAGRVCADDLKVGDVVYYIGFPIPESGNEGVDPKELAGWPAKAEKIDGERVSLGRGYVLKDSVLTLHEAFDYCVEQVRSDPSSGYFWRCKGVCSQHLGEMHNARKDFDQAIRLDPNDGLAYSFRGYGKLLLNDSEGALVDLDKAISLKADLEHNYLTRATAKWRLRDYQGAMSDDDEALRINPNSSSAYANRGFCKAGLGDMAGALKDSNEAIRLKPDDWYAHCTRGGYEQLLGEYSNAIKDYLRAIELEPKALKATCRLAFLYATCPDEKVRDASKAMQFAQVAQNVVPDEPYTKNAMACTLALQGNFEEAIKLEESALTDILYAVEGALDGGLGAKERIAAWKEQKLWLTKPFKEGSSERLY